MLTISVFPGTLPGQPRFLDIAPDLGLDKSVVYGNTERNIYILETTGTGAAVLDFDNDGDNDLLVVNGTTLDESAAGQGRGAFLYRNDGERFAEIGAAAGLNRVGWGQGVCAGDFDSDGFIDVAIAYFGWNALYRNVEGKRFEDVTAKGGLPTAGRRWGAGCAFVDYDGDGRLDLFFSNYVDLDLEKTPKPGESPECRWKGIDVMCGPRGLPRALNVLYRNEGDGKFQDVSEAAGILKPGGRYGLGVVAADFNNDSLPDLYVACDMTPSLLYVNQGDGTFEEVGAEAGVAYNASGQLQAGMGVAVADYDGNGFLDIAKTNFSGDLPSLFQNEDGVFFDDVALQAGLGVHQYLGWGIAFLDVDLDGRPDLLTANGHVYPEVDRSPLGETYRQPLLLYRNRGDGRFEDIGKRAGPAFQEAYPARGMAVGDLDGDGRPEVVVVNVNAPPAVLRDAAPPQGSFLWLKLEGKASNRSAIGARVTVEAGGRTQIQEVVGGGGYYSQSDLARHFGLGPAKTLDRLEVRWPSGAVQKFEGLAANRRYRLVEGGKPTALDAR